MNDGEYHQAYPKYSKELIIPNAPSGSKCSSAMISSPSVMVNKSTNRLCCSVFCRASTSQVLNCIRRNGGAGTWCAMKSEPVSLLEIPSACLAEGLSQKASDLEVQSIPETSQQSRKTEAVQKSFRWGVPASLCKGCV